MLHKLVPDRFQSERVQRTQLLDKTSQYPVAGHQHCILSNSTLCTFTSQRRAPHSKAREHAASQLHVHLEGAANSYVSILHVYEDVHIPHHCSSCDALMHDTWGVITSVWSWNRLRETL
jgi:hypothetical protein